MLRVPIEQARPGMILAQPVVSPEKLEHVLLKPAFELDAEAIVRLRKLRVWTLWVRYPQLDVLDDVLDPAILGAKLPHLSAWNARRRAIAARYRQLLADLPLDLPADSADCEPVYHLFVVRTPQRDALRQHLKSRDIGTGIHYPLPLHLQPAFAHLGYSAGDFPETERAAGEVLSLPIYPELTDDQLEQITDTVRDFFQ